MLWRERERQGEYKNIYRKKKTMGNEKSRRDLCI